MGTINYMGNGIVRSVIEFGLFLIAKIMLNILRFQHLENHNGNLYKEKELP